MLELYYIIYCTTPHISYNIYTNRNNLRYHIMVLGLDLMKLFKKKNYNEIISNNVTLILNQTFFIIYFSSQ